MAKLRLSLTIPGAVSLGAYEGGVLAALVVAARTLGEETVLIDTIASASAGSITGLLTARALLRGCDPVELLSKAWVENVSFDALKSHSTASPLSNAALDAMANQVLGPQGVPEGDPSTWQSEPIMLSMAVNTLAGFTYEIANLTRDTTVSASTFLDFYTVTLDKTAEAPVYVTHAQGAIASGSNAMGFPPKLLNRKAEEAEYEQAGLEGFPADGNIWYTDGGTVDNEPLGRTIDLAGNVTSDDDRLYLLIHPDPGAPTSQTDTVWSGDSPTPPWLRTATHALSMARNQSIYDDLRTLEKTNTRLAWVESIVPALEAGLNDGMAKAKLTPDQQDTVRASLASSLSGALGTVRQQQHEIKAKTALSKPPAAPPAAPSLEDYRQALRVLITAASGLEGRDEVKVEVVSPALGADPSSTPASLLAGLFLFHFGGFIDIKFRQSDFALGYRNMTYWLKHCLGGYLPGVDLAPAFAAVDAAYDKLGWDGIRHGGSSLNSLSLGEKVKLIELAGHVAHVVEHDVHSGGA